MKTLSKEKVFLIALLAMETFLQEKEVVVVGGGNSALEEAAALTNFAIKVTIVHQFDHFQAFEHAIEEAKSKPKN
jgi:thioredoxin reductase (NADPH)